MKQGFDALIWAYKQKSGIFFWAVGVSVLFCLLMYGEFGTASLQFSLPILFVIFMQALAVSASDALTSTMEELEETSRGLIQQQDRIILKLQAKIAMLEERGTVQ